MGRRRTDRLSAFTVADLQSDLVLWIVPDLHRLTAPDAVAPIQPDDRGWRRLTSGVPGLRRRSSSPVRCSRRAARRVSVGLCGGVGAATI